MTELVLVIDLGTQSIRGTAVDCDGRTHFRRSWPIATVRDGSRCEQDPVVWRHYLRAITTEAQTLHGDAIRAVVATGTLSGLVCLDSDGEPLGPAVMYGDQRSRPQAALIDASPHLPRWGGWRAHSCDFLPQLLYLKQEHPEVWARTAHVVDATGYLNFLLTGAPVMDAWTRYHCYADHTTPGPPEALLQEFDLDAALLGRLASPGEVLGGSPPVIAASYDSICAYLGAGLRHFGDALDISGTVTSFGVLHHSVVADPLRRVYSLPWNDGTWLIRGSTAMSGGVLEWARREIVGGGFEEFDALAATSRPGANGVLFLPFLAGERAPVWKENACGTFFGIKPETGKADLARAVYEGLCYSLRHIQSVIEELGVTIGTVRLAGGLARNATLNRIKADITGKTLRPLRELELTTLGCVAIAGHAIGWYVSMEEAQGRLVASGPDIQPDPATSDICAETFRRYVTLVDTITPLFD